MTVGQEEIFLIFLIVILIISIALTVFPVFSNISRNKCIMKQWALINSLDRIMNLVEKRGTIQRNHSFLVMPCTECMWYDPLNSLWWIQHVDDVPVNKSLSYDVIGVAQNCFKCDEPSVGGIKCANLMKGETYNFEIGTNYVKCTNCPDSPNVCGYPILFGSRFEVGDDVDIVDPTNADRIALVSYQNTLYLFYHKEGTDDIYYKTSADGINWNPEIILTDGARTYGWPSVGVFNNELYVGYSGLNGGWEIFVKKFDGAWSDVGVLTDTNANQDGGSHFAVYGGNLYLFYHSEGGNIRYKSCGANCGAIANWGGEQVAVSSGDNTYPSAIEYGGNLYLSYSKDEGDWEIYYKYFDGSSWSAEDRITDTANLDGGSHLIVYDNRLYVFYHETTGLSLDTGTGIIFYKAYDGGWQRECGVGGGKKPNFLGLPAPTIRLFELNLCYIKYDGDWKIVCH